MELMRDINRVMGREIAKGSCPLKLDHIEVGDYSYQEITSKEKLLEVLSYLLRIGDFKQYAGKTILNNVYMDLRGKKPIFKRTRTAIERNNIFATIKRCAKKLKPEYNGDVYLETVRCHFDISQENLEKCRYTYQGNETYAFLIATFNEKNNLLDNTLRIANVYNRKLVNSYTITSLEELKLIIWILVKNKIYFEEIVILGMAKEYKKIVNQFSPFIQEENCKRGEIGKHSAIKVICNGKLGLLQILSAYIYLSASSEIGNRMAKEHQKNVCQAIYEILLSFSKIDMDYVKEFLQFDKLNDIFSRVYSELSITSMSNPNGSTSIKYGAAKFIHNVYANENIKRLKANDPNYWLQRAKSIYITNNYRHAGSRAEILEAIDWAKKAEQDSRIRVDNGETKYFRTESNAIMQIAMLYGRLAKLYGYAKNDVNELALEYYYKVFSDTNNIGATKTLLNHSRGTEDFTKFVNRLISKTDIVGPEWSQERNYLLKIGLNKDDYFIYHDRKY